MDANLIKKLLEHSKEAHFFHLGERERISSQIVFCLGGLGLIANACIYYLDSLPASASWIAAIYWILVAAAIVCGIVALCIFFHVLGFFIPNEYQVLQSPKTILTEIKRLDALSGSPAENPKLSETLDLKLTELYAVAAAINESENERRKILLRKVVRWSIFSLIFLFANALPFFYFKSIEPSPTQAVKIVAPIKVEYERTTGK